MSLTLNEASKQSGFAKSSRWLDVADAGSGQDSLGMLPLTGRASGRLSREAASLPTVGWKAKASARSCAAKTLQVAGAVPVDPAS